MNEITITQRVISIPKKLPRKKKKQMKKATKIKWYREDINHDYIMIK